MYQDLVIPLLRINSAASPYTTFCPSLLIVQLLHLVIVQHDVLGVQWPEDAGERVGEGNIQGMTASLEDEGVQRDG